MKFLKTAVKYNVFATIEYTRNIFIFIREYNSITAVK